MLCKYTYTKYSVVPKYIAPTLLRATLTSCACSPAVRQKINGVIVTVKFYHVIVK